MARKLDEGDREHVKTMQLWIKGTKRAKRDDEARVKMARANVKMYAREGKHYEAMAIHTGKLIAIAEAELKEFLRE